MPTPFTHLAAAQRLLDDTNFAPEYRDLFRREVSAFLLGNVAADARNESGSPRAATHFYDYAKEITGEMPWQTMLRLNPGLWTPQDEAHLAFVAGYVAHLSMDEIWSREMVGPYFINGEWGDRSHRWVMLHIILTVMDERDEHLLGVWQGDSLAKAAPQTWTPFLTDFSLINWRDLIAAQIQPGGHSLTLEVFGARANKTPEQMRLLLDNPADLQAGLWQYITPEILARTEAAMYDHAVRQAAHYLSQAQISGR